MKSEEPPVIPPYDSDENLLKDDNVDEQEDESDEEEVSLGDFDEQGKMTVDSGKSHDLILFLKCYCIKSKKNSFFSSIQRSNLLYKTKQIVIFKLSILRAIFKQTNHEIDKYVTLIRG